MKKEIKIHYNPYADEFINSFPGRNKQQIRRYIYEIRKGTRPLKVKNK